MAYQLTDQDRMEAQNRAQQILGAQQPVQKKGNFLTSLLPTAGGILGGIGGSILAPGLGTAAGGAAGAGLGKVLQNLFEGNKDVGQGVLGEAALGTLGGVGKGLKAIKGAAGALKAGQGLSKAAQVLRFGAPGVATAAAGQVAGKTATGLVGKVGKSTEKFGKQLLSSQSNLGRGQARQILGNKRNVTDVLSSINKRTGLSSLDDMAEISGKLTGGKGSLLDTATRAAVNDTTGVKINNLRKTAEEILGSSKGFVGDRKLKQKLLNDMTDAGSVLFGGTKGSLSTLAKPDDVLDMANSFRKISNDFSKGFSATGKDKQLASFYNKMANSLEKSLYNSPGVKESIPTITKAVANDLRIDAADILRAGGSKKQATALQRIAAEIEGVDSVPKFRTSKKDFVDVSRIFDATEQARAGAGAQLGGQMQGLGKFIQRPLNLLAAPLNAATPQVADKVIKAGQAMQAGGVMPRIGLPNVAKIAGTQLLGRGMTGTLPSAQPDAQMDDSLSQIMQGMGGSPMMRGMSGGMPGMGGASSPQQMYSKDAVAKDIQADLQRTGGANMDKYITLYNFLNPEGGGDQKYNSAIAGNISDFQSSLSELDILNASIESGRGTTDPILGRLRALNPYDTEQQTLQAAIDKTRQLVGRALEGGVLRKEDEEKYKKILPTTSDTKAVAIAKIAMIKSQLEAKMQHYTSLVGGGQEDPAAILSQFGY
jgi:hypothetical protein